MANFGVTLGYKGEKQRWGLKSSTGVQTVTQIQATYFDSNIFYIAGLWYYIWGYLSRRASTAGAIRLAKRGLCQRGRESLLFPSQRTPAFHGLLFFRPVRLSKLIWGHSGSPFLQAASQTKKYSFASREVAGPTNRTMRQNVCPSLST